MVEAAKRAGRWTRWALIISLALNLIVIGAVVGTVLRHGSEGHRDAHGDKHGHDMAGGPLTQALSREDRRAIGREMRRALSFSSRPKRR